MLSKLLALTLVGATAVFSISSISASAAPTGAVEPTESRAYLHNYNIPSSGLALEGYCPVAYFAVNRPVRGKRELASTHNGVTYYLASKDAKKAFDASPEKYLPAFGGWCAFGMAVSDKFPVDPTKFKIVDGRLFVFLANKNVDALELWNQGNEKELLEKADAYWNKLNS